MHSDYVDHIERQERADMGRHCGTCNVLLRHDEGIWENGKRYCVACFDQASSEAVDAEIDARRD